MIKRSLGFRCLREEFKAEGPQVAVVAEVDGEIEEVEVSTQPFRVHLCKELIRSIPEVENFTGNGLNFFLRMRPCPIRFYLTLNYGEWNVRLKRH